MMSELIPGDVNSEYDRYYVDVPDIDNPEGPWKNIDSFCSFEEAVEFVKTFGGDEQGCICLVSGEKDAELDAAS